jgi:PAS domain S-box-containing protein
VIESGFHAEQRDRPDLAWRHRRAAPHADQEDAVLEHSNENAEPRHAPFPAPGAWHNADAVLAPFATVLVETATDAIVLADSRGTIILWNNAARALFGYTGQEAIGKPLTLIMPARYRDAHAKGLERVCASGHSRLAGKPIELQGLKKDGSEFPIELSLGMWNASQGPFFSGIIRDITERKRSEEALRESQERFRQLAENIREVFWMTDVRKERMIYISPAYEGIWGRTCDSLYDSPRSWLDSIHPDDRDRVIEAALTRQVSGAYSEEYRIVRPDGSTRWIWDRAFPIRDASGQVYRIAGIAEDLTERKQTELALQQAYNATEVILDSVPGAILVADSDLHVVYANALACRYFGEAHTDMIGALLNDVLPAEVAQRSWVFTRRTPQTAENGYWQQDRQFESRGKIYQYRFFPLAIRGSERMQTGIVLWDITENKRLADQIMQAEKLASLGTLVAGMAHEVNNPAQSIMGLAQLLDDETDLGVVKEYAGEIVGYTKHIATVVRDFLTYARQSNRDDATDLDLGERMAEAVKLLRRSPQFGHIEVVADFQAVPPLHARRTEIDQVFVNLVSNAVQAMDGKGCLTLTTSVRGNALEATVRDTGGGIPPDRLTKIFDPFYTTKEPGKGTGLGLYIVYKIVNQYGGKVHVDSTVGHGTAFTVAFPVTTSGVEKVHHQRSFSDRQEP